MHAIKGAVITKDGHYLTPNKGITIFMAERKESTGEDEGRKGGKKGREGREGGKGGREGREGRNCTHAATMKGSAHCPFKEDFVMDTPSE